MVDDDFYRQIYASLEHDDLYILKVMLILRKNLNDYDYDGRTPLGVAASDGNLKAVKYLVSHGANIHHRDARGNTALDDAIRSGHTDVQEFLEQFEDQDWGIIWF